MKRKYPCILLVTKTQVLMRFVALIYNERKCKFQLEISENKDVIFFYSKFIDPMEVSEEFD